jgi:hypothetical protein
MKIETIHEAEMLIKKEINKKYNTATTREVLFVLCMKMFNAGVKFNQKKLKAKDIIGEKK